MGWELTITRSDKVTFDHKKKTDGVRVDHEKERDRVRVHHEKERWGESLP